MDYDREDQRWHEVVDRALMDSLQSPRAAGGRHPAWWGPRLERLQRRFAGLLESREAHYFIIGLVSARRAARRDQPRVWSSRVWLRAAACLCDAWLVGAVGGWLAAAEQSGSRRFGPPTK